MRRPALSALPCILAVLSLHAILSRSQSIPGYHRVERLTTIPLDPPVVFPKKSTDPAKLQQDAEELARLSEAIPAQIKNINHTLPKDLNDQLKQIEKLAKRLRSEISQAAQVNSH
jgi:hypothetical protein